MFAIVIGNSLLALDFNRSTELFDVARERLSKHLRVQARELAEDVLEHEVLVNGVALNRGDRHVFKF